MALVDAQIRELMKLILTRTLDAAIREDIPFERVSGPKGAAAGMILKRKYTDKAMQETAYARAYVVVGESEEALEELAERMLSH